MIFATLILLAFLAQTEGSYSGHCDGNKLLDTMQHMIKCKGHSGHRSRHTSNFVGFDAKLKTNLKGLRVGHIINFNDVFTNIGNGYKDGVFTCPVTGVYYFSWTILTNAGRASDTYIMLNGKPKRINYSRDHTGKQHYSGTTSILLYLKKGDRVWIQMVFNNSNAHNNFSFFSGMLMKSD